MSFLQERYQLSKEQEEALLTDGVISSTWCGHWEIYKHYSQNSAMYKNMMDNIEDCCLHFNCHYTTVYRAIKRFKNGTIPN